jgi:GNAT superfamily N-acetyltransferase
MLTARAYGLPPEAVAYRDLYAAAPLSAAARSRMRAQLSHQRRSWRRYMRSAPNVPAFVTAFDIAVAQPEHADEVGFLIAASFELSAAAERAFAGVVGRPGWVCHVALEDGQPVAAALMRMEAGVAWLGFAATRPDRRGRGARSALIATRMSAAAHAGCRTIVTEAPISCARTLVRAGFVPVPTA